MNGLYIYRKMIAWVFRMFVDIMMIMTIMYILVPLNLTYWGAQLCIYI